MSQTQMKAATAPTPVMLKAGISWPGIQEVVGQAVLILESDVPAHAASLAQNLLRLVQAAVEYDLTTVILEIGDVNADFKKIAETVRKLFNV